MNSECSSSRLVASLSTWAAPSPASGSPRSLLSTRRISATDSSLVTSPSGIFPSQSANKSTSSWPSARNSSGAISIGAVLFFNVSTLVFIAIYIPKSASRRILTAQSFKEIRFTSATAIHQTERRDKTPVFPRSPCGSRRVSVRGSCRCSSVSCDTTPLSRRSARTDWCP